MDQGAQRSVVALLSVVAPVPGGEQKGHWQQGKACRLGAGPLPRPCLVGKGEDNRALK